MIGLTRRAILPLVLAAPAIVRFSSLMPVKPLVYERAVAVYDITMDSWHVYVDASWLPLWTPRGSTSIDIAALRAKFPSWPRVEPPRVPGVLLNRLDVLLDLRELGDLVP